MTEAQLDLEPRRELGARRPAAGRVAVPASGSAQYCRDRNADRFHLARGQDEPGERNDRAGVTGGRAR